MMAAGAGWSAPQIVMSIINFAAMIAVGVLATQKSNTDAVQLLDHRITAIETTMAVRTPIRDSQIQGLDDRLKAVEGRRRGRSE